MAKHNVVYLYGMLTGDPSIQIDKETNEYKKGICHLAIVRPDREYGVNNDLILFDKPMIYSADPEIVKEMATWKKTDLIWIKGVITVLNIDKVTVCKECGVKNKQPGEFSFITPVFAEKRVDGINEAESVKTLKDHREVSNQVYLIGYLCNDVTHNAYGNKHSSAYQLAVNRKFFLKSDEPTNRTDYPHIRSYGERSIQDAKCLKQGSMVLVDGMIQTRSFRRVKECESCGHTYEWEDTSMEITAFDTEYLQNYETEEALQAKEQEELEKTKTAIFG